MADEENHREFRTGAQLLAQWPEDRTREQRLARAVTALMRELDDNHVQFRRQSLKNNLANPLVFCSCVDAYRMGAEALKP